MAYDYPKIKKHNNQLHKDAARRIENFKFIYHYYLGRREALGEIVCDLINNDPNNKYIDLHKYNLKVAKIQLKKLSKYLKDNKLSIKKFNRIYNQKFNN